MDLSARVEQFSINHANFLVTYDHQRQLPQILLADRELQVPGTGTGHHSPHESQHRKQGGCWGLSH